MLYLLVNAVMYVKRIYLFYTFFKLVLTDQAIDMVFHTSCSSFFRVPCRSLAFIGLSVCGVLAKLPGIG